MPCIIAARLRAQAAHSSPALLAGLLDDDAPAPGLDPHPTAWQIDLDRPCPAEDGAIAFPATLTVGRSPGHAFPQEAPVVLAETRYACRFVVSGGGNARFKIAP
jgi:hypothetical protein